MPQINFGARLSENSIEVIVMDGNSKDGTVQIVQKYPVKVISIRLNAPAAYNYAMKIASHPVLGFVDADAKIESNGSNFLCLT